MIDIIISIKKYVYIAYYNVYRLILLSFPYLDILEFRRYSRQSWEDCCWLNMTNIILKKK